MYVCNLRELEQDVAGVVLLVGDKLLGTWYS